MKYKILTADHIGYTVEKWSIIMWYALDIDDGIYKGAYTLYYLNKKAAKADSRYVICFFIPILHRNIHFDLMSNWRKVIIFPF